MDVELGIAGVICVGLGLGHMTIGVVWALPRLKETRLPSTPFGAPSMTLAMVRVTWHIVTIFVLTVAGILLTLAWTAAPDPKELILRSFAAMWFAATAMAVWVAGLTVRKLRNLLRLPVPLLFAVVAVLCWMAAS